MNITQSILVTVPLNKVFDFAKLMKINEFKWITVYWSDPKVKEYMDILITNHDESDNND